MLVPMNRDSQRTLVAGEGRNGVRGDADGASDLLAPVEIGEEMLAETLASHWGDSVAGGRKARLNVGAFELREVIHPPHYMEDHQKKRVAKWGPCKCMKRKNGDKRGQERGMSSKMGRVGVPTPGFFCKCCI